MDSPAVKGGKGKKQSEAGMARGVFLDAFLYFFPTFPQNAYVDGAKLW